MRIRVSVFFNECQQGQEAIIAAGLDPSELPTVFSSSGGDGYNCDTICETLASEVCTISPTRFHNSAQNAPAGYWGYALSSKYPMLKTL